MLHGLAGSSLEVARLGQVLQQAGLTVLAPDIPGFAFGTPPAPWQNWVDTARAHLHQLKAEYTTVSVVGISMGATLAMELAALDDVTSLVLLAPGLAYDGWAMPWYRVLLPIARYIPFHERYKHREGEPYGVKNPALRAMVKKMMADRHVSVVGGESISLSQLMEGGKLIRHVRKRVSLICDPLLILHAIEDECVHPRNAQYVHQQASSVDKELILLGDCYHMITVDNERDTVFYETEMFIKRCINAQLQQSVFEVPQQLTRSLERFAKWSQAAA